MPFNFPSSPAEGQLFTPPGGPTYIYFSPAWRQIGGNFPDVRVAPDRNVFCNGSLLVSQENGDAVGSTSGYYFADEWALHNSGFTVAGQRFFSATGRYVMGVQNNANKVAAAGDVFGFLHKVEGLRMQGLRWGTSLAVPALLNFKLLVGAAGTYGCALRDAANAISCAFDLPVSAGEVGSLKEFTLRVPPPTTGTFNLNIGSAGLSFYAAHSAGSTFKAPASNVWGAGNFVAGPGITNNAALATVNMQIADLRLVPDPDNVGVLPPFVTEHIDKALMDCLRYYWKCNHNPTIGVYLSDATFRSMFVKFPATMRSAPAMGGVPSSGSIIGNTASLDGTTITVSGVTAGSGCSISGIVANARM